MNPSELQALTTDELRTIMSEAIIENLNLHCPNYCLENDEQVTLRTNPKYCFVLKYICGLGQDNVMAAAYARSIFSDRTLHYPAWVPNHLLIEPRLLLDDENDTLYRQNEVIQY